MNQEPDTEFCRQILNWKKKICEMTVQIAGAAGRCSGAAAVNVCSSALCPAELACWVQAVELRVSKLPRLTEREQFWVTDAQLGQKAKSRQK